MTMDDAMTKRMLDRCDLHWDRLPQDFFEAPFLGNGGLGAAVYVVEDRLSFIVNDSRYADHQTGEDLPLLFGRSRLPVGRLSVRTRGDLVGARLVLGLHDATLRGTVTTTRGVFSIDAYVHATEDLLVVDLDPAGGERVEVEFEPATARSPRLDWNTRPEGLATNPAPVVTGRLVEQDLVAGGRTATRWVTRRSTVLLTVAHTFPHRDASRVTQSTLEHAGGLGELRRSHRRWWHHLYRRSAVILPDARLQSFYWTQVYKIASATREDRPVMATTGPWLERTPWPATWWNLNTQLSYWMIQATGHRELDAVTRAISEGQRNLALNVPSSTATTRRSSAARRRTISAPIRWACRGRTCRMSAWRRGTCCGVCTTCG
ncbi:hypothetical protein [Brachybacterium sp. ACRRE]|uniref:hypothetical protein n=1 Tax=Brachybacterium sp. ACRRE TaxID=2918184 RepID=UPI001EF20522|nr:hypothetical protein [Brachybacterium sp. ACRRE]MCG7310300.1 hypothetical protein [Brachybacterium sp. ACRRE]